MKRMIARRTLLPMAGIVLVTLFVGAWILSSAQTRGRRASADHDAAQAEAAVLDHLSLVNDQLVSRLDAEMKIIQAEARDLGTGRLGPGIAAGTGKVPDLLFGRTSQARLMDRLERINGLPEGSITIYVLQGDELVRLSTNAFVPDGTRAAGTTLDAGGAAHRALIKGRSYWGPVETFGELQLADLEPVRNAAGDMIGAFGVQCPLGGLATIHRAVHRFRILDSGFLAVVGRDGRPLYHGGGMSQDAVRDLLDGRGRKGGAWIVRREPFDPWGLEVVAAYPERELEAYARLTRWSALGVAVVLVFALTFSHFWVLRANLLRPLGAVLDTLEGLSLNPRPGLRFPRGPEGEIGALSDALNGMLDQIQARDARLLEYQEGLEELVARRLAQLVQAKQLLSETLDALPACLGILDGDGRVLLANRRWTEAAGSANPLLAGAEAGSDYGAILRRLAQAQGEQASPARMIVEAVEGRAAFPGLEYGVSLEGGSRWFEVLATRFRVQEEPRTVLVHLDITDRRVLELQLRQAQKLESIGQLAAGIAHEINTPTQFIGDNMVFLGEAFQGLWPLVEASRRHLEGSAALAERDPAALDPSEVAYYQEEIPKAIEQSLEGIRRVSRIVGAMKDFSHPGSDRKVPTDLNHALETTALVSRNEWKFVADVAFDLDPALPPVPCFPDQIHQALVNLIVNAAQAIEEASRSRQPGMGVIRLSTRREGQAAAIQVEDTGAGIPETIRSRIFDPFFTTKAVGKGTGQGLAIVYAAIVDSHGGTISLDSEVGRGTTITLRLPLDASPEASGPGGASAEE